jgi:deoxyribonuclease IV
MALLGSHVARTAPLAAAVDRDADVIQVYVSAPRAWRDPIPHGDEAALAASQLPIVVHAPYLVNPASGDPDLRARSRHALESQTAAAARLGAFGVVVHAGRVGVPVSPAGGSPPAAPDRRHLVQGIVNWLDTLEGARLGCRLLVENTAGGRNAIGRQTADLIGLVTLLRAEGHDVGIVFDTCHAHAAGLDLVTAVGDLIGGVGAIDLVHANDSKDPAGSGRDRHQNLGAGTIDPDNLVAAVAAAGAPVVVETPGRAAAQAADIAWLRQRLGQERPGQERLTGPGRLSP